VVVLVEIWYKVIQETLALARINLSLCKPRNVTGFPRGFWEIVASVFTTNSSPVHRHKPVTITRCKSPQFPSSFRVWITLYLALRHGHFLYAYSPVMLRFDVVVWAGDVARSRNVQTLCVKTETPVAPEDCTGLETGSHVCLWKSRGVAGWGLRTASQLSCCTCSLDLRTCLSLSYCSWKWNVFLFSSERHMTQLLAKGGLVVSWLLSSTHVQYVSANRRTKRTKT
jgi:hypothetical protein